MCSSGQVWRQETEQRLRENVEVAYRRSLSAQTFVEGLVAIDEYAEAKRCLTRFLAEVSPRRVAVG